MEKSIGRKGGKGGVFREGDVNLTAWRGKREVARVFDWGERGKGITHEKK